MVVAKPVVHEDGFPRDLLPWPVHPQDPGQPLQEHAPNLVMLCDKKGRVESLEKMKEKGYGKKECIRGNNLNWIYKKLFERRKRMNRGKGGRGGKDNEIQSVLEELKS